jgi:hypothetical protein
MPATADAPLMLAASARKRQFHSRHYQILRLIISILQADLYRMISLLLVNS